MTDKATYQTCVATADGAAITTARPYIASVYVSVRDLRLPEAALLSLIDERFDLAKKMLVKNIAADEQ